MSIFHSDPVKFIIIFVKAITQKHPGGYSFPSRGVSCVPKAFCAINFTFFDEETSQSSKPSVYQRDNDSVVNICVCVCLITSRGNSCSEYGPNVCVCVCTRGPFSFKVSFLRIEAEEHLYPTFLYAPTVTLCKIILVALTLKKG